MYKEYIADVCENLYKECLSEIPQIENNQLLWILNGSTLCNFLYNVVKIDEIEVTKEFNQHCYDFIRQPKGDIDISYKADRPYQFNLENKYIKEFQNISQEQRTYNFVDSNSELLKIDYEELCNMETKNGLKFIAKRPEYLFLYKFKEFLSLFNKEIMINDITKINKKNKNIINDIKNLYKIAVSYCGKKQLENVILKLPSISIFLSNLYQKNNNEYIALLNEAFKIINFKQEKYLNENQINNQSMSLKQKESG